MEPQKIQLAIQGGGAKIVDLLAAMDALQDFVEDGKITVTRMAGTSAGAIAGALFAAHIPMGNIRDQLKDGKGRELLENFSSPNRLKVLLKFLLPNPSPIWSDEPLRQWLGETFKKQGINTIKELNKKQDIPIIIVSTDLRSRSVHKEYKDEDSVVDALLDSSGLPLLFRVWSKNTRSPTFLDGGICENLPSDLLTSSESNGDVVAITFDPTTSTLPENIHSFALSLLDTAISHSVRKARNSISDVSVLSINTHIDTFDFKQALDHGLGDHYEITKNKCIEWFTEYLAKKEENRSIYKRDPWRSTDPTAIHVMESISEVYNQQHMPSKINYQSCAFIIHAHGLLELGEPFFGAPDRLQFSFVFEPVNDPIFCIRFGLGEESEKVSYIREKIDCKVLDKDGQRVGTTQVPVRNREYPLRRDLCVFFDRPLRKGEGSYTINFAEEANNLIKIDSDRIRVEDEMIFEATRAFGEIDNVHLIIHVPQAFSNVHMQPRSKDYPGIEMTQKDLDTYGYHPSCTGFITKGWLGSNIPATVKDWGVDIKAVRNNS